MKCHRIQPNSVISCDTSDRQSKAHQQRQRKEESECQAQNKFHLCIKNSQECFAAGNKSDIEREEMVYMCVSLVSVFWQVLVWRHLVFLILVAVPHFCHISSHSCRVIPCQEHRFYPQFHPLAIKVAPSHQNYIGRKIPNKPAYPWTTEMNIWCTRFNAHHFLYYFILRSRSFGYLGRINSTSEYINSETLSHRQAPANRSVGMWLRQVQNKARDTHYWFLQKTASAAIINQCDQSLCSNFVKPKSTWWNWFTVSTLILKYYIILMEFILLLINESNGTVWCWCSWSYCVRGFLIIKERCQIG